MNSLYPFAFGWVKTWLRIDAAWMLDDIAYEDDPDKRQALAAKMKDLFREVGHRALRESAEFHGRASRRRAEQQEDRANAINDGKVV